MTVPGLKAPKRGQDPPAETLPCIAWQSSAISVGCGPDRPPRLCRKDLKDPERFHQRLVDWLMKQR